MARYYTEISKEDFLSHIKYMMLNQDGSPCYGWAYEEEQISKTILKDISKVQFDFENCTGYEDNEGYLDGYLAGYNELVPGFHTFWVSAGGDWEIPVNFMIYWGDNRLRGYIPKDGNVWDKKYKTAYGSEGDSELFDWSKNPQGYDPEDDIDWDGVEKGTDSSKMITEVLGHITKRPKNDEYVAKQPAVPDYTKKPKEEEPDYSSQTVSYEFFKPIIIRIGGGEPVQERVETKESKLRSLERRLESALVYENYELAAQLRDEITKLKNEN